MPLESVLGVFLMKKLLLGKMDFVALMTKIWGNSLAIEKVISIVGRKNSSERARAFVFCEKQTSVN
jgi:hypothetical protein